MALRKREVASENTLQLDRVLKSRAGSLDIRPRKASRQSNESSLLLTSMSASIKEEISKISDWESHDDSEVAIISKILEVTINTVLAEGELPGERDFIRDILLLDPQLLAQCLRVFRKSKSS